MSNTCALRSLPACSRRSKNGQKPSTRFAEDPKNLMATGPENGRISMRQD
jgi:hypothetical protein